MSCCFRGRSLNFTTNLYVNFISIHIPTLHTLFSFIPTDHEITHQWSGNPHSWDSIYQHQRKPQRLLVKLLTNKFNTKDWKFWLNGSRQSRVIEFWPMTRDAFSSHRKTHLRLRYKYEFTRNFGIFKHEKRYSKPTSNRALLFYYMNLLGLIKTFSQRFPTTVRRFSENYPKATRNISNIFQQVTNIPEEFRR